MWRESLLETPIYILGVGESQSNRVKSEADDPPDHRRWLYLSQWVHRRWRRWRVVRSGIHSVPCTVKQFIHLSVGQRRQ